MSSPDFVADHEKAVKVRFIAYHILRLPFFKHVKELSKLEKFDYQQKFKEIYLEWSNQKIESYWVQFVEALMDDMNSNTSIIGKTLPVKEGRKPTPEWHEIEPLNKDVIYIQNEDESTPSS
jgi:6-phosphogluconate dehydrogenase